MVAQTITPILGHNYKTTSTPATCTEAGTTKKTCSRCGDTQTETTQALGHTYDENKYEITEATCTEAGKQIWRCERCEEIVFEYEIPALEHSIPEEICEPKDEVFHTVKGTCMKCSTTIELPNENHKDATGGWDTVGAECERCHAIKKGCSHIWDSGTVTISATCQRTGQKTKKCTSCGETKTETIAKRSHSYTDTTTTLERNKKSDATCTSPAVYYKECKWCTSHSSTQTFTSGSALGHNWTTVQAKAATCLESGYSAYEKCTRCQTTKGRNDISALGHNWTTVQAKAATCLESGYSAHEKCTRCQTTRGRINKSATGHTGELYTDYESYGPSGHYVKKIYKCCGTVYSSTKTAHHGNYNLRGLCHQCGEVK